MGEKQLTIRQRINKLLSESTMTAKDLSAILGIKEKEVCDHLPHVEKSLSKGLTLIAQHPECLRCGFIFEKRQRFTIPSRCPKCKSESVTAPLLSVTEKKKK